MVARCQRLTLELISETLDRESNESARNTVVSSALIKPDELLQMFSVLCGSCTWSLCVLK